MKSTLVKINLTEEEFINTLNTLNEKVKAIPINDVRDFLKNCFLPQLVDHFIKKCFELNYNDNDVEVLRYYYKRLQYTGVFNFKTSETSNQRRDNLKSYSPFDDSMEYHQSIAGIKGELSDT